MKYDAIVIGMGGVGSAALYHLARRGVRAVGLDRFPPGHDRGSSHGQTRIIRQAYFEHPDYVPLLQRAYQLWADLSTECSQQIFEQTGLLEIGPPDGVVIPGVRESVRRHRLPLELVSSDEMVSRFPGFILPDGYQAVFEPTAGYLHVEACVRGHAEQARRHGAEWLIGPSVLDWRANAAGVSVRTEDRTLYADRLVIAAGSWAGDLLADLGIRFRVLRKHLHWYSAGCESYSQAAGCPAFFYEVPAGYYYGFPDFDGHGLKVAEHSGGEEVADPLAVDRSIDEEERRRVELFLANFLPQVTCRPIRHAVCLYTVSPDEHFIVDRHPATDRVVFAAGLSGHGFKFTSVLGEVLADLTISGETDQPLKFLKLGRLLS